MEHSRGRLRIHQPGERIGDLFPVVKLVGQGIFGAVYDVEDSAHKIRLVCKEMDLLEAPPGLTGSREDYLESFHREAVVLKTLHHPNVIPVDYLAIPVGEWVCVVCGAAFPESPFCAECQGRGVWVELRHYILMQSLDGETLEARYAADGRPLTWEQVKPWFLPVASAVAEMHRCGVLHRDIKPENVLLERSTHRPFLLDPGLIKVTDLVGIGGGMGCKTRVLSTKTQAIGTPGYAAPEVWRGEAEPASDIYALGMLLFWALTGRDPGNNGDQQEMLPQQHQDFNDAVPRAVWAAAARAVKVSPKDRFTSVHEFVAALMGPPSLPPRNEPRSIGVAEMDEEGTITLRLRGEMDDGTICHGTFTYAKNHPEYEEILTHLGEMSPGDVKIVPPWPPSEVSLRP